jgi:hypothetical protein
MAQFVATSIANTGDNAAPGTGTLRAAIIFANAAGKTNDRAEGAGTAMALPDSIVRL